MEPEGSLPHSQVPANCPYPKPDDDDDNDNDNNNNNNNSLQYNRRDIPKDVSPPIPFLLYRRGSDGIRQDSLQSVCGQAIFRCEVK
jgi:hypothetical protein